VGLPSIFLVLAENARALASDGQEIRPRSSKAPVGSGGTPLLAVVRRAKGIPYAAARPVLEGP
jgi:hypothetical protein